MLELMSRKVMGYIACDLSKGKHIENHPDRIVWSSVEEAMCDLDGPDYAIRAVLKSGALVTVESTEN